MASRALLSSKFPRCLKVVIFPVYDSVHLATLVMGIRSWYAVFDTLIPGALHACIWVGMGWGLVFDRTWYIVIAP
jgi:hypothetical protein